MTITVIDPSMTMEAIQEALNKPYPMLIFKYGTYDITKQLIINSNTSIIAYSATLRRMGVIQSIFITKATANTTGYNGAKNITIDGGTLEGMGVYKGDNLLTLFHASDVKLYNVTFKDAVELHHLEINSSEKVTVSNCNFFGYKSNAETFREAIQIDFAGYSELVIAGTSPTSLCYDLTCCRDITIVGCKFDKSENRPSCNVAIGSHTAPSGGNLHTGIYIMKCDISSDSTLGECAINLFGMQDVHITDCKITGFPRAIRLISTETCYKSDGTKVTATPDDGIVKDVYISMNKFIDPVDTYYATGIFSNMANGGFVTNVNIYGNEFIRGDRNPNSSRAIDLHDVIGAKIYDNKLNGLRIIQEATSQDFDLYGNVA